MKEYPKGQPVPEWYENIYVMLAMIGMFIFICSKLGM